MDNNPSQILYFQNTEEPPIIPNPHITTHYHFLQLRYRNFVVEDWSGPCKNKRKLSYEDGPSTLRKKAK